LSYNKKNGKYISSFQVKQLFQYNAYSTFSCNLDTKKTDELANLLLLSVLHRSQLHTNKQFCITPPHVQYKHIASKRGQENTTTVFRRTATGQSRNLSTLTSANSDP
jgi:hypothetical protein